MTQQIYFHLVDLNAPEGQIFLHNLKLGRGKLTSISLTCEIEKNSGFQTKYSASCLLLGNNKEKESTWEEVRKKSYPSLPSRMKSLYLFDNEELAITKNKQWFDSKRVIIKVEVAKGSTIHKADAIWLDCNTSQYQVHAENYWAGNTTPSPCWEILVHGVVQVIDWHNLPKSNL